MVDITNSMLGSFAHMMATAQSTEDIAKPTTSRNLRTLEYLQRGVDAAVMLDAPIREAVKARIAADPTTKALLDKYGQPEGEGYAHQSQPGASDVEFLIATTAASAASSILRSYKIPRDTCLDLGKHLYRAIGGHIDKKPFAHEYQFQ